MSVFTSVLPSTERPFPRNSNGTSGLSDLNSNLYATSLVSSISFVTVFVIIFEICF